MIDFIQNYGIFAYGVVILFGGLFGVEYLPCKWETKYKFGAFAAFFAVVFILIELFVSKTFQIKDATKYLLTFCVVAVMYQYLLKSLFEKWGIKPKEDENKKP